VEIYWQTNAVVPYTREQIVTKMLDAAGVTRRASDDETRRDIADAEKNAKVDARDQFMRLIDTENTTLGDLVKSKEFVIAGHVVLYVVAKGSAFRRQFLDGDWEL